MKTKTKRTLLVLYIAIGIITFGHVWHREWLNDLPVEARVMFVPVTAVLWPLYLSEVIWGKVLHQDGYDPEAKG